MRKTCILCDTEKTESKFYPNKEYCFDCYKPLTVAAVKDFQTCALLYKFRHVDQDHEPLYSREAMQERYGIVMKKLAAFFFYKRQGGVTPSFAALVNRWERHWFPKDMTAYDIAVQQDVLVGGNLNKFNTEATAALLHFYEVFSELDADPLLIQEPFLVTAGRTKLSGDFDLVLRTGDGKHKVIKWTLTSWKSSVSNLLYDFAALKYAFEFRNDVPHHQTEYSYYDLSSPKGGLVKYEVEPEDVNALLYWAREAFEAEVYIPRRGLTSYCKKCPFDTPCANFKVTKDLIEERFGE